MIKNFENPAKLTMLYGKTLIKAVFGCGLELTATNYLITSNTRFGHSGAKLKNQCKLISSTNNY